MRRIIGTIMTAAAALCIATDAQAAVVDYGFSYTFAGQTYEGTFSLDDAAHTVTAFAFDLDGKVFGTGNIVSSYNGGRHPVYLIGGALNGDDVVGNIGGNPDDNDFFFNLSYDPAFLDENSVTHSSSRAGFGYPQGARFFYAPAATPVPEPATWAMLILGLFAAGGALRRRQPALVTA